MARFCRRFASVDNRLRLQTSSREQLKARLQDAFPNHGDSDSTLSPHIGGRREALRRLEAVKPAKYAKTRNSLDGAVTQLSPFIRHRVLSLAEVRDAALQKVGQPSEAFKLIQELAWHDYFQRVYAAVGDAGMWRDLEPWKTGLGPSDYASDLPSDVEAGETGIDWVDHFARQLSEEGWLHNHARMWLACYVVHVRQVRWQAGAAWFLRHLVDGDVASNNLSWQWVASTFSAKPYFMNRENVVKFSGGRFPRVAKNDPLDKPYHLLQEELFADGPEATQDAGQGQSIDLRRIEAEPASLHQPTDDAVAWVHEDMLNPEHPALVGGRRGVFVFDQQEASQRSLKPIAFIAECLAELPNVTVLRSSGDGIASAVRAFADGRPVVTGASPSSTRREIVSTVGAMVVEGDPFVELDGVIDLKRFSRYWRSAQQALGAQTGGS